jgi:hypothetical protein
MLWKNKSYFVDNLPILREHVPDESVDLVYLNQLFNSDAKLQRVLQKKVRTLPRSNHGVRGPSRTSSRTEAHGKHLPPLRSHASHYLKLRMDAVFDVGSYRNEVIWKRTSAHVNPKRWGRFMT